MIILKNTIISPLQTKTVENSIINVQSLNPGGRTVKKLTHKSSLLLEHDIPYLLIYQKKANDDEILKLVKNGSSYLTIDPNDSLDIDKMLKEITRLMSQRFGCFLIMEIFSNSQNNEEFVIYDSNEKLSKTFKKLSAGLKKIKNNKPEVFLNVRTKNYDKADSNHSMLRPPANFRQQGGTWLALEIPVVYKNPEGNTYPVYFKKFRKIFTQTLQKSIFDFIRIQTSVKISSYHALGARSISEKVFQIDKQIRSIQDQYSFLLLVAPINNESVKDVYFKSNHEKLNSYHYRLLPVDPDILKRKLYNLKIDEIDDPALAFIYDEKREEIDQELTMLKERGSKNFYYSSIRLYKDVSPELLEEAVLILQKVTEEDRPEPGKLMDVTNFKRRALEEFQYFQKFASDYKGKVHIQKDLNIMMVCNGELFLPANYQMSQKEATALLQHEIGTHMLTHFNGNQQPLKQMAYGLAGYDELQEGLAVFAEYLTGSLCKNRLRTLAGRIVAGDALLKGADFHEMFQLLHNTYSFSAERTYDITSRMFQGGGFLKDIVYLKGLHQLQHHLKNKGELKPLLAGKFALKHLEVIKSLTERGLLVPPKIYPRYLENKEFQQRVDRFKNGIPLYKMI